MINRDKVDIWKEDVQKSVDLYNSWFLDFVPETYRRTRVNETLKVEESMKKLDDMKNITPYFLMEEPAIVEVLRMCTAPPIASDRLLGLSGLSMKAPSFVKTLEKGKVPRITARSKVSLEEGLQAICHTITKMLDKDIFTWVEEEKIPDDTDRYRASTIIADRLCGSVSNPIIRNAQEARQLNKIERYLEGKGYTLSKAKTFNEMEPGTYSFRINVPGQQPGGGTVNIPVDTVIKRKSSSIDDMPILIECKSAGDFANTNKRRKEESQKLANLRNAYGQNVEFLLFLCGYFDTSYLGYEAAEGIDWIWEHRMEDFEQLDLD